MKELSEKNPNDEECPTASKMNIDETRIINLRQYGCCTQAKKMKKQILIIISLFYIFGCTKVNQNENLIIEIESLKTKNDSLNTLLNKSKIENNYWYDAEFEGKKLIKNGIKDPSEFIENSLRQKTELIPLKAVLGGKINFDKIQLLSSEWLIADYSDGHVQGKAIYKYKINKKGELEFELLNSIEPE